MFRSKCFHRTGRCNYASTVSSVYTSIYGVSEDLSDDITQQQLLPGVKYVNVAFIVDRNMMNSAFLKWILGIELIKCILQGS